MHKKDSFRWTFDAANLKRAHRCGVIRIHQLFSILDRCKQFMARPDPWNFKQGECPSCRAGPTNE